MTALSPPAFLVGVHGDEAQEGHRFMPGLLCRKHLESPDHSSLKTFGLYLEEGIFGLSEKV